MDRMTKDEFFATAPPHLVQAVKEGKGAHYNGEMYTLNSLGIDTGGTGMVDLTIETAAKDQLIKNLQEQVVDLSAKLGKEGDSELLEELIPKTESALKQKSEALIVKIAEYRGLETEDKEKDDLIAELLKGKE
jgi:transcriptional regulator CtsR